MFCRQPVRIAAVLVLAALPMSSRADVVRLPNGGEIRGSLHSDPQSNVVELETLHGGRVRLDRAKVVSTSRRKPLVEEYITRSREIPDSIDAHWELAEWCRNQRLIPQREEQLEAILALDPAHAQARRGLGHVRYQGQWMTRDESMKSQGYVKHKGKYITTQEFNLLNKTAAQRESELAWYPRIRLWFGWVTGRSMNRQYEGLTQLKAVEDVDAIPALYDFLGDCPDIALRMLLVSRLQAMAGEKPVPSLVRISLQDAEKAIRTAAFRAIDVEHYSVAVPYYVEALESDVNVVVQRAGTALGVVGDSKVVPPLIHALITNHKVTVTVALPEPVSISQSNGRYSIGGSSSGLPPNVEIALRTGQLPYGVRVIGPPSGTRYQKVTVRVDYQNEQVLESLKKLTSRDYGYDQNAWQLYWAARQSGVGRL